MQPHGELPNTLKVILRSIAIVAQQRVLADRSAALGVVDQSRQQPATLLNRTPFKVLQTSVADA